MTQDYTPIKITENTPEPKENHSYYLVAVKYNGVTDYKLLYFNSLLWFGVGSHGPVAWPTVCELLLSDIAGVDGTVTIQSLADHDAQIRAEEHVKALELTDYELEMLEDARTSSDEWGFGKDIEALKIGIEAVADHRKEQK